MKLYYHPLSTYSQKTMMGLHEKGATFTSEIVTLFDPESRAAYEKVNPYLRIPMLTLDDGYKVPESSIILEWADQHVAGGTKLIPDDRDLARKTRFHDRLADLYLADPCATIFFDGRKAPADKNPKAVEAAKKTLDTTYKLLDGHFEKRTWALGDTFSMADCSHAPALAYLRMLYPYEGYKHLTAYAGRLFERPSYQKVSAEAAPYLAKMQAG